MKMESPLEVLSRAVSIVQNGHKGNMAKKAEAIEERRDSGIESDSTPDYPNMSPNYYKSNSCNSCSPKTEPSNSPLNLTTVQCESPRLLPRSPSHSAFVSRNSPRGVSESVNYEERLSRKFESGECVRRAPSDEFVRRSPSGECLRRSPESDEFVRRSPSGECLRRSPSGELVRRSPSGESESSEHIRRSPSGEFVRRSSGESESGEHMRRSPSGEFVQRSPSGESESGEHMRRSPSGECIRRPPSGEFIRRSPGECVRRSPKRLIDHDEKKVKKIKIEETECEESSKYQMVMPVEKCTYKCSAIKNACTAPRHVEVLPSYMQAYPYYQPLFIFTDKPPFGGKSYSTYAATYDSLFSRPPVHSPAPPPYSSLKCCYGKDKCPLAAEKPKYSAQKEVSARLSISNDYELPNVDEHFRKSLGDKYDTLKCEPVHERPSSVDEHFAKALGNKWVNSKYSRCASS